MSKILKICFLVTMLMLSTPREEQILEDLEQFLDPQQDAFKNLKEEWKKNQSDEEREITENDISQDPQNNLENIT